MSSEKIDYRKLNSELDEILDRLQNADLDIDQAIEDYEKGMKITKKLEKYLKEAEIKIKKAQISS